MSLKLLMFNRVSGWLLSLWLLLTLGCSQLHDESVALSERQPLPAWQVAPLVNQYNQTLTVAELRGKPTLVHVVFTRCSMVCPLQVATLSRLQKQLSLEFGVEQFNFLSVSATPYFDDAAAMKLFAERFSVNDQNWHFVTGEQINVESVLDGLVARVSAANRDGLVTHSNYVYLLDGNGQLANKIQGVPMDKQKVLGGMRRLLEQQAAVTL